MWLNALMHEMDGAGPYIKYFYIQLCLSYSPDVIISKTVAELYKLAKVSPKVVCDGLAYLEKENLIRRYVGDNHRVGRPKTSFSLNASLCKDYGRRVPRTPLQYRLIQELFVDGGHDRNHPLTACNRLLMAILIMHMDSRWLVSGLGRNRMAILMGVEKHKLKHRIETLEALGYIRDKVSGLSHTGLFGKVAGAYYLNPCCEHWYANSFAGGKLFYYSGRKPGVHLLLEGHETKESYAIVRLASRHANPKIRNNKLSRPLLEGRIIFRGDLRSHSYSYDPIACSFSDCYTLFTPRSNQRAFCDYLQFTIEEYASYLLSDHWADITEDTLPDNLRRALFTRLEQDETVSIFKNRSSESVDNNQTSDMPAGQAWPTKIDSAAAELICQFAYGIARFFVEILEGLEDVDCNFEGFNFRIAPRVAEDNTFFFALELFLKEQDQSEPEFIRIFLPGSDSASYSTTVVDCYQSIDAEELIACGLEKNRSGRQSCASV